MSKVSAPSSVYLYKGSSIVELTWKHWDGNYGFVIERSVNGGSWVSVNLKGTGGDGSEGSYGGTEAIQSGWATIQYRIYAISQYSWMANSDWSTSNTLTLNSPPAAPSSIYVPSSIQGGSSCSVSWNASSDSDGNLSGYKLERSLNGGGWSQVYSGASTSYSDYIGTGYSTVAYRVKAYDSAGAESGYTTSSTRSITNNRAPSVPPSITVPATVYGGASCYVYWGASSDPDGNLSGYKLERSLNGGGWSQIYSGSSTGYTDTIGTGYTTVAYRVRAYDLQSAHSGYRTSSTVSVINNQAPAMPSQITLPDNIAGGKEIVISWSASTDPDNNLSGYRLQRSVDGGTTWTQIYQSSGLTYTDRAGLDWTAVQYRVCAYDTPGLSSGWRVSAQKTVVQNAPPTEPEYLQVPLSVTRGEAIEVAWGGSADPDGNFAGYELQRSTAENPAETPDSWEPVYKGPEQAFEDTAGMDWDFVTYRVRSYDMEEACSGWVTAESRMVDSNHAPVITCKLSGDLGKKTEAFSFSYSVSDADGDGITVLETIDGVEKRKFAAVENETNLFSLSEMDFLCLLNGAHTLEITATDDHGKASLKTATFVKEIHHCRITMETPFETDALITKTILSIARNLPVDAPLEVLLTNNAKDDEPIWEDATKNVLAGMNYAFANETTVNGNAYNFIVTIRRGESGQGGYIDSIGGAFE